MELFVFAREFVREARMTGSFFPTGRVAARALTRPLRDRTGPLRVLELGPGTGAITAVILESLRPGDTLDICEINERFLGALRTKLESNPDFVAHREQVRFLRCAAQALPDGPPYDVIVCSLPFFNFDVTVVQQILARLGRVSHASTHMSLYSYDVLQALGELVGRAAVRSRVREVSRYLDAQGRVATSRVWWNLPPLTVYAMQPRPLLEAGAPYEASAELASAAQPA